MAETIALGAIVRLGTGKGAARSARRQNLVPGVVYGAGNEPQPINVKLNELLKLLKAGKFKSTLISLTLDGKSERVICRDVQRNVVNDLPTHIDLMRLSDSASINLFIPVNFENQATCPGIKRGGVLTVVRPDVELIVPALNIPEQLTVDLNNFELGDTIHISDIKLPEGTKPTITGRDFVIANIQAPSGLKSSDNEASDEIEEETPEAEE
ncbi:MAG: 50S ribosomal protein L25 [Rhodobacteraceae bacterium]|nr:MAG: 50S ribosomal protein L25 [Paracoccaceae bacterium]|tara:strand:- start:1917 stop:2549 length:633 start_codon:yes stop_codon:yes gene_type:complete